MLRLQTSKYKSRKNNNQLLVKQHKFQSWNRGSKNSRKKFSNKNRKHTSFYRGQITQLTMCFSGFIDSQNFPNPDTICIYIYVFMHQINSYCQQKRMLQKFYRLVSQQVSEKKGPLTNSIDNMHFALCAILCTVCMKCSNSAKCQFIKST